MTTHPGQTDKKSRPRWPWVVGGVAVLGTVMAISQATGGPDEYDAEDVCRQAVEDRLVSPSSADFSRPDVNELMGSGTAYRVAGSVDADNRAGASVRITYECKAEHVSGSEWEIIDLQTSER